MTYLSFHLTFLLPPIALLLYGYQQDQNPLPKVRASRGIPLIASIAFLYTSPWDNYLVARRIWWYGPERVLETIGYVPIEEYLFFILQPLLTSLFAYQLLSWWPTPDGKDLRSASWIGAGMFLILSLLGVYFLTDGRSETLYLALILVWACPLLVGMWIYDGATLWAYRSVLFFGTSLPTLYLWMADAFAISKGIWTISPNYTTGIEVFGLPVEEATFFLLTNLLVVQGILLLLYSRALDIPQTASATR